MISSRLLTIAAGCLLVLAGCTQAAQPPTPVADARFATPVLVATDVPTPSPIATVANTATTISTNEPSATPTVAPTSTDVSTTVPTVVNTVESTATSTEVSTPVPLPTATPIVVATATPAPVVLKPTATPPGSLTVTTADNRKTISLAVGQSFLLSLGDTMDWSVTIADQNVVSRRIGVLVVRGAQGIFVAKQPGQTTLTAVGDPLCRQAKPACAAPSMMFQVTLVVR